MRDKKQLLILTAAVFPKDVVGDFRKNLDGTDAIVDVIAVVKPCLVLAIMAVSDEYKDGIVGRMKHDFPDIGSAQWMEVPKLPSMEGEYFEVVWRRIQPVPTVREARERGPDRVLHRNFDTTLAVSYGDK